MHVRCDWPWSYSEGLLRASERSYLVVIVEHDIVPTPGQVHDLVTCPHDFCATDYELSNGQRWAAVADHGCLGLSKITHRAWDRVTATPKVPNVDWRDLAGTLGQRLGYPHVHPGPADHRHVRL